MHAGLILVVLVVITGTYNSVCVCVCCIMYAENQGDGGTKASNVGLSIPDNTKDTAADESKTFGSVDGATTGTYMF